MLTHPLSVLVVEDDAQVRKTINGVLSEAGFKVATAATGWTALKIIESKPIDLVVADVALPGGFSGVELMQCARLTRPLLRCLFISGSVDGITDDPDRDDFVGKPFCRSELIGCAWELLLRDIPKPRAGSEQRQAERLLVAAKVASRRRPTRSRRLRHLRARPGAAQRTRARQVARSA
jgi:DNA-binding response OmpR family regulator